VDVTAAWRWDEAGEALAADLPDRQLSIRWDAGDRGWFLSVIYPPRPATMGQAAVEARVYICPLPLLCALVLVPPELHHHLTWRVKRELDVARGQVLGLLSETTGLLPQAWPGPSGAAKRLDAAAVVGREVERLALDWAAHDAMES
jgi:hypothetical protein